MTATARHSRKMSGGIEESRPCPVSRVSTAPVSSICLYDQARKALSERSPFDAEELTVSRVSTLPVGLADFLSKYSCHHSRKKQKKSHPDSGAKSSSSVAQPRHSNVWTDTEDYFRPLTSSDIENLVGQSSFRRLATGSCFSIPNLQEIVDNSGSGAATSGGVVNAEVEGNSNSIVLVREDESEDKEQVMGIDGRETDNLSSKDSEQSMKPSSSPSVGSGLECLLSVRNKVLLTTDRPSKKRKLLGRDAGLERLCIARPSEGHSSPVCHLCSSGDLGEESNQFLVCDSCKVALHQKCYGVQDVPDGLWLCSWCNQKDSLETGGSGSEVLLRPCLLCPKQGGALKPVVLHSAESKNGGSVRFAHLFCSQWIPEVYIDDTRTMEPILNVEGIKETRKKLVCYLCKLKYGASVRCSHGTCRTAFHPICAREAKHRMEIWGKIGCENVELRVFCSKHSECEDAGCAQQSEDLSTDIGCISSVSKHSPLTTLANKPHQLKLGCSNGDKSTLHVTTLDANSDKLDNSEASLEENVLVTESNAEFWSDCCDAQLPLSTETSQFANNCDTNPSQSLDVVQAFKKLVDRGKAVVSDVALEIGISSDLLVATLASDQPFFSTDLQSKIVKWLQNHAYLGTLPQNLKSGANLLVSSRARVSNGHDSVAAASCNNSDVGSLQPVSPRKAKHKIRILKDEKVVSSATEAFVPQNDAGIVIDEINANSIVPNREPKKDSNSDASLSYQGDYVFDDKDALEKVLPILSGHQDLGSSMARSFRLEAELSKGDFCEIDLADMSDNSARSAFGNFNGDNPFWANGLMTANLPDITEELASCSYMHPIICERLIQLKNGLLVKQGNTCDNYGQKEKGIASPEAPLPASIYCSDQDCNPHCSDAGFTTNTVKLDQLDNARQMGILKLSPNDEVEGQLIYFQNKLLDHAVANKCYCDTLIFRLVKSLPQELGGIRKQRWDSVLVNQYLCHLKEVKKQGRKEKRHKEAQAVLAAAAAAAAASSRLLSFRKDAHDEEAHQEAFSKVNVVTGRTGPYSQLMPRAKETLSRLAVGRPSLEKRFERFQSTAFSKDHSEVCDICRRSETMLNPILVCSNCKVAVHLVCYRNVKDPAGPWYCELCEELALSRSPRAPSVTPRESSGFVSHCGLCGGTSGAFRKSTDGQWVHAFCAEWLLERTFKKGLPNLIEGMETILKEKNVCCICGRKVGVCIKCNYGNCQSTFHPSCARNAGFHMHVKTGLGKLQHKAYCEKHSLEQREKAELQQHGAEELKSIKQIRVELERLRLLCERIIKREKLKRELVLCSHDILASKRDSVAFSVLVRSPFFLPDVSSESATTSLRGHVGDNKSCSEAIQRSEDVTVDTAVSCKRQVILPVEMDIDQKTDDSSTSQRVFTRRSKDRLPFSGKQIPNIPASAASRNQNDDGERIPKSRKHTETFHKEVVMTSYQASVQNQRLPKGFAYVPVVCLPKEKPSGCNAGSREPLEPDG